MEVPMEVIIASMFSALIILITVLFMIRVLYIGYKRKEINFRQLFEYVSSAVAIGALIAISLPFAYAKLFHWVLGV